MSRLESVNIRILGLEFKKIKTVRLIDFAQGTMINFVRVCLLGTMFWLVYNQSISLGQFFSLYFYSFFIFSPLYMLGTVMQNYQEAKASDDVIRNILDMKPEEKTSGEIITPTNVDTLSFNDVSF